MISLEEILWTDDESKNIEETENPNGVGEVIMICCGSGPIIPIPTTSTYRSRWC